MWGKLTSLASVVTGQDGSDEEEEEEKGQQQQQQQQQQQREKEADDQEMQLVEQQKQIIHLKEMVREREINFADKENELKKLSVDFSRFKLQSKSKLLILSKQVQEKMKVASETLEKSSAGSDGSVSTLASEMSSSSTPSEQKWRARLSVTKKQLQSKDKQMTELSNQLSKKCQEIEGKERVIGEKDEALKMVSAMLEAERSKREEEGSGNAEDVMTKKELQSSLEEMIIQIAYKDNKILQLINQISEKEGGAMDLRETVAEKDVVIEGRDRAIALLRTSLTESAKREEGLQATIDRLKWRSDDLEEEVQRLKNDLQKLGEGPQKLDNEKELDEVTEMRERFSALLAEEKANSSSALEKVKAACEARCRELESRLADYGASRDALTGRVEELKGLLEGTTREKDELIKKMKAAEEAEFKEGSVESKFSRFKALAGSKIKALEKEIDKLKKTCSELTSLRNRVTELEEEKGNLQLQLLENEDKLSKKEIILMQLDEMRQQCEDLLLEINNLRDKNATLEEVAKKQDLSLTQLKKAESERETALIRAEEQEATIRCLEARFEGLKRQIEEKNETISHLEHGNSNHKQSCNLLEEKLKSKDVEISRLNEMNSQLKENIQMTDSDLFAVQKSSDDLKIEYNSRRREISSLNERMSDIRDDHENLKMDFKSKTEELDRVQFVLGEKNKLLEDASIRLVDAVENSSELSRKLEAKTSELQQMKDGLETLAQKNVNYLETIKFLTITKEKLENRLSNLPGEYKEHVELSIAENAQILSTPSSENVKHDAPVRGVVMITRSVEESDGVSKEGLESTRLELERLKSLLREREEELENVRTEYKELELIRSEYKKLKIDSEERDQLLENKSGDSTRSEYENLITFLGEKDEIIEKMRKQIEKLNKRNSELENLEAILVEKNEIVERMVTEIKQLHTKSSELETLLPEKDEIIRNILLENDKYSRKLNETETLLGKLNQDLAGMSRDSTSPQNEFISSRDKLTETQSELSKLKETLTEAVAEKDKVLKTLNVKDQELVKLSADLEESRSAFEEKLKAEKCIYEEKISNLEILASHSMREFDVLKGRNEELEALKSKNLDLETSRDKLAQEVLEKQEAIAKISKEIEEYKDEMRKILLEKDSELDVLRIVTKENKQSHDKTVEELEKTKIEANKLRDVVNKFEREIKSKDDKILSLSKGIEIFKAEGVDKEKVTKEKLQTSSDDLDASTGRVKEMQDLLLQLNEELNKSKIENAESRENLNKLEKKMLDKDKKIESLSEILEDEETQLIASREELEKLKKSQEANYFELKTRHDEVDKLCETLNEKDVAIKKYLAIMKKQKESLRQVREDLNQSLSDESKVEDLRKSRERIATLEQDLENFKSQSEGKTTSLEDEIKMLKDEISRFQPERSVLENILQHFSMNDTSVVEEKVKNLLIMEKTDAEKSEILKHYESELGLLKEKLGEITREKENLLQQIKSQNASIESNKQDYETLLGQKNNSDSLLSDVRNNLQTSEKLLESLNAEKVLSVKEVERTRCELDELEKTLETHRREHEGRLEKITIAHDRELEEIREKHRETIESFNSEIELGRKKLINFKKEIEVVTEKSNELKKIHEADMEHFGQIKQGYEVENLKLTSQNSDLVNIKSSLENNLKEITLELGGNLLKISLLSEENRELKQKVDDLKSKFEGIESTRSHGDLEMVEFKSKCENLQFDLFRVTEENSKLNEENRSLLDRLEKFQLEKVKVDEKLEELSSRSEVVLKENEFSIHEMKVEMEKLHQSAGQEDLSSRLKSLRDALDSSETSRQTLEHEIEALKGRLSEKIRQNEGLTKQLQLETKKYQILETEFEGLRLDNQLTIETVKELETQLNDLKKFNHQVGKREEGLTEVIDRLSKEIASKDKKLRSVEDSTKKGLDEMETKVHEMSEKIVSMEKAQVDADEKIGQNSQHEEEMSRLKESHQKELNRLEEELQRMTDQSAAEQKSLRDQFDLLSNDVASYQYLISKLENNKKHLESQMNEVKPMISKLKEELTKLENDRRDFRQMVSQLEAEKMELLDEIDSLRQRVKMAEDLEDNLELDYKQEVTTYKERLKELEEVLEKSRKSEEELNQVNDKLLQHNNALIENTEDLFEQLNRYKTMESDHSSMTGTLASVSEERNLLKAEVVSLKRHHETARNELEALKSRQPDPDQRAETIIHERLQGASPPVDGSRDVADNDNDLPRVHSGKLFHLGSPVPGDVDDAGVRSQLEKLTRENKSLGEKWRESERKYLEKDKEQTDFYQQYHLLYQQYTVMQQHLNNLISEKEDTAIPSSSLQNENTTTMVPYEKYKDLESMHRQLKTHNSDLEKQLRAEQEQRNEVEEGLKVIRDQYEHHRLLQTSESHSITIFSDDGEDDRRILPQDANLYLQLRHKCLQFRRMFMRMDQTRLSLGTIYRYRSYILYFLVFYFISIHILLLFRC